MARLMEARGEAPLLIIPLRLPIPALGKRVANTISIMYCVFYHRCTPGVLLRALSISSAVTTGLLCFSLALSEPPLFASPSSSPLCGVSYYHLHHKSGRSALRATGRYLLVYGVLVAITKNGLGRFEGLLRYGHLSLLHRL